MEIRELQESDGWPMQKPERCYELYAETPDVSALERVLGRKVPAYERLEREGDESASLSLRFLRWGYQLDQVSLAWWRREVERFTEMEEVAKAMAIDLAHEQERMFTREEADSLASWAEETFKDAINLRMTGWRIILWDGTVNVEPNVWNLRDWPTYQFQFDAVVEPGWVLPATSFDCVTEKSEA